MSNRKTMRQAVTYLRDEHGLSMSYFDMSRLNSLNAGPRFKRLGNMAMYEIADLDAWANERKDDERASA